MTKYTKLFEEKRAELKARENALKVDESISKNTRNTQLVKTRREQKTLTLIAELLAMLPEDARISKDGVDHIVNITTLVSERASAQKMEIKVGAKISELLKFKNAFERINKWCAENECEISFYVDPATGKSEGVIIDKKAKKAVLNKKSKQPTAEQQSA